MPTDRELMQQALDLLPNAIDCQQTELDDHITKYGEWYRPQRVEYMKQYIKDAEQLMDALRARLAQPEPEPVAWGVPNTRPTEKAKIMMLLHSLDGCQYPEQLIPLYTAPPQREWQGLTDEDINDHWITAMCNTEGTRLPIPEFARAIEAKLKEKNSG
jgi:hypothetical protein